MERVPAYWIGVKIPKSFRLNPDNDPDGVVIDFYYTRVYDQSGLEAINRIADLPKKRSIPGLSSDNRGLIIDFSTGIPTPWFSPDLFVDFSEGVMHPLVSFFANTEPKQLKN